MIVKYKAELDAARHPVLVREQSYEYEAATMDSPEKIITMMNDCFHLSDMAEEYVYMLALNAAAAPVGVFEVSHGCVNYALIKPRELYIRALLAGAVGIVVVHNHTSGEVVPSREDISACAGMKAAGDMIGITFFDFIIAGKGHIQGCVISSLIYRSTAGAISLSFLFENFFIRYFYYYILYSVNIFMR